MIADFAVFFAAGKHGESINPDIVSNLKATRIDDNYTPVHQHVVAYGRTTYGVDFISREVVVDGSH